ncbi:MAG: hypothetical protein ACRDMX_07735 [Solirubrobacteraceae bacterium]
MSDHGHDSVWKSGEDVQLVENVLNDSKVEPATRRLLLRKASAGLLGAGGLGVLLAACGSSSSSSSSAATTSAPASSATSSSTAAATTSSGTGTSSAANDIPTIINTAVTAEALAVTYLTAVVTSKGVEKTPVGKFLPVLKAANAEEYDHYKVLLGLGAKPIATKFWVPNAFLGHNLSGVFPTLQVAETLFVNAYLIGITAFAQAGKGSLARYASEIAGTEAQHLVLANYAAGKMPPNDLGFMDYSITSIGGIVAALEKVGVGFGKQGSAPGSFASFSPPPANAVVKVLDNKPS